MNQFVAWATLVMVGAAVALLLWQLLRPSHGAAVADLTGRLDTLRLLNERLERALREDAENSRVASSRAGAELREEVRRTLTDLGGSMTMTFASLGDAQGKRLDAFSKQLDSLIDNARADAEGLRKSLSDSTARAGTSSAENFASLSTELSKRLAEFSARVESLAKAQSDNAAAVKADARDQLAAFGAASQASFLALSRQVEQKLKDASDHSGERLQNFAAQLAALSTQHELAAKLLRESVESRLVSIQNDNALRLEQMRATVDEKLQGTLDRRLGESFKQVSERLEQVQRGLGEMHSLGSNVTDLTRLMSNVKTRGTWGEWQLASLLEQMLAPDQYCANFRPTEESREVVEFAVRLPGRGEDADACWLPIDSKFPAEAYERLTQAADAADAAGVDEAGRALESAVRKCAADIAAKYVNPPRTTNFAVLFLPSEGLYAEAIRRRGLIEDLQRLYRVTVAGPSTLAAYMSSLQMGFHTLAIQKRTSEVEKTLGAVKTEFNKFGDMLDKVEKKLDEAKSSVEKATGKTRTIKRALRDVGQLPAAEAQALLPEITDPEFLDEDLEST